MVQVCPSRGLYMPSCCIWALIPVDMSVDRVDPQAFWLWGLAMTTEYELLCWGWLNRVGFATAGTSACQDCPLSLAFVGLIGCCSLMVWSWPLNVLVLVPFGKGSHVGQGQSMPLTGPGRSYKVIFSFLLPLLDLKVHGRGLVGKWGWLSPAADKPQAGQQNALRPTVIYQLSLKLKEPQMVLRSWVKQSLRKSPAWEEWCSTG